MLKLSEIGVAFVLHIESSLVAHAVTGVGVDGEPAPPIGELPPAPADEPPALVRPPPAPPAPWAAGAPPEASSRAAPPDPEMPVPPFPAPAEGTPPVPAGAGLPPEDAPPVPEVTDAPPEPLLPPEAVIPSDGPADSPELSAQPGFARAKSPVESTTKERRSTLPIPLRPPLLLRESARCIMVRDPPWLPGWSGAMAIQAPRGSRAIDASVVRTATQGVRARDGRCLREGEVLELHSCEISHPANGHAPAALGYHVIVASDGRPRACGAQGRTSGLCGGGAGLEFERLSDSK